MTAVLDRVPVDEITAQARQARPGHALLTVVAAVFFGLGWCAGAGWLAVAWCGVAVREGWREAVRAQRPRRVSRGAG